jgi:hypothetical protein
MVIMLAMYHMTTPGSRGLRKGAPRSSVPSVPQGTWNWRMQCRPSDILVLHRTGVWLLRRGTRVDAGTLR